MTIDSTVLILYLIGLIGLGAVFSHFNKNLSDYIRGGAKASWWLGGASMLMASISAFTFTGNASAAFLSGPSLLWIYAANCAAFLVCALYLAARLRQTRAHTIADLIKERFGTAAEQFNVVMGVLMAPFAAAVQLWALALFTSSVFDLPLIPSIILIGAIVVAYSTMGGRWAVMATDFAQGLLLFGVSGVVFFLSLWKIGGIDAFFSFFSDPRVAEDFQLVNEPGAFPNNKFTWHWAIIIFFMQIYYQVGLRSAHRFLSLKDGREASKAAWFCLFLTAIGSVIWFLPPMVARFIFETEVLAQNVDNPADFSYVYIAQTLLPKGMMGLMVAAMFAATMSSMDTALNAQAGILVRNFFPGMRKLFGRKDPTAISEMNGCRLVTVVLGLIIVTISVILSRQERFPLFDAYLFMGSVIGIPMGFPLLVGIWIKKLPGWSYFFMFGMCLLPSIYSLYDESTGGTKWSIQDRAMWIFIFGIVACIISRALYFTASQAYQNNMEAFFLRMATPVNFVQEVGEANDASQGRILGRTCLVMGALVLMLAAFPNSFSGRMLFVALAGFMASVGLLLSRAGRKS